MTDTAARCAACGHWWHGLRCDRYVRHVGDRADVNECGCPSSIGQHDDADELGGQDGA